MLTRLTFRLGQLLAVLLAAAVALAAASLAYVVVRVSWWLITEHSLIAAAIALAGGLWAALVNYNHGRAQL